MLIACLREKWETAGVARAIQKFPDRLGSQHKILTHTIGACAVFLVFDCDTYLTKPIDLQESERLLSASILDEHTASA